MEAYFELYIMALAISACITGWITWYTWKKRTTHHTPAFAAVVLSITWWLVISVLDTLITDHNTKILLNKLGYLGVLSLPVAWYLFSIQFSGRGKQISPLRIALLLIIPVFLLVIIWRGQLWSEVDFDSFGPYEHTSVRFTVWVWPQMIYCYVLILIGSLTLARTVVGLPKLYRYQTTALLVGVAIPLVVNGTYLFGVIPNNEFDLTPIGFAFSGMAFAWGLFRYQLLTLIPIAQNTLIENIPMGFIVVNDQLKVVDLNPAAEEIVGSIRAKAIGRFLPHVFPIGLETLVRLASKELISTTISLGAEDNRRVFELRSTRIGNGPGNVLGYLLILQDITPRILAEHTLASALSAEKELNELRSKLITSTSHEFRTPLSVILSSVELLEHYGNTWSPRKRFEHLNRIKSTVQHMTRMVEEILVVGKVDAGKVVVRPVPIDLVHFCETILEEIRLLDQEKHSYSLESTSPEIKVLLDELQLRQILSNLLENASKYSPGNTRIRLCLSAGSAWVNLDIHDEGLGIPENDQIHLWEPFYRGENVAHLSGTGLGLTIVNKSLELIGGSIEIHSVVNQGTHVHVMLPIHQPTSPPAEVESVS